MTGSIYLLTGLIVAATASTQAHGQSTGTLVPGHTTASPVQSTDDAARQARRGGEGLISTPASAEDLEAGRHIVRCVVESKPIVAVNYLNGFVEKQREGVARAYRASMSVCLHKYQQAHGAKALTLSLSQYTNYSLLAEAYLKKYGIPKLDPVPLNELLESPGYRNASLDYRLSSCLAFTQPEGSRNLVASDVGSPEESKAFAALAPHVPGCVPAGATLSLDKSWLRLRLATSLYLRAVPETPRSRTTASRGAADAR